MTIRVLAPKEQALLHLVVEAVRKVEPGAQVVLYGLRARGDAGPDSDWDLLVLLDGPVDRARGAAVRRRIYAVERSTNDCPVLSALVESRQEWDSPALRAMPLHTSVERDGIRLGPTTTPPSSGTGWSAPFTRSPRPSTWQQPASGTTASIASTTRASMPSRRCC